MIPAIVAPALLLAAIAATGALLGGAIIWARNRQRRRSDAARQVPGQPGPGTDSSL